MALNSNVPSGPLAQKWDRHKFDLKLVNPANKRKFDVIVVGTGLAGAAADHVHPVAYALMKHTKSLPVSAGDPVLPSQFA